MINSHGFVVNHVDTVVPYFGGEKYSSFYLSFKRRPSQSTFLIYSRHFRNWTAGVMNAQRQCGFTAILSPYDETYNCIFSMYTYALSQCKRATGSDIGHA